MSSLSPALTSHGLGSMGNAQRMVLQTLSARTLPFRVFHSPVPVGMAMPDGPIVSGGGAGRPQPGDRTPAIDTPRIDSPARRRAETRIRPYTRARRLASPGRPFWKRWLDTLLLWQKRAATRQAMLQMSDHVLKDIGLTRSQVVHEAEKPIWRE